MATLRRLGMAIDRNALEDLVRSAQRQLRELAPGVQLAMDVQRQYRDLLPAVESLRRTATQMEAPIVRVLDDAQKNWSAIARGVAEQVQWVERAVDKDAAKRLRKSGWLALERHLDWWTLESVIRRNRSGKALDRAICLAFRKNRAAGLRRLTKAWSAVPYLSERRALIRRAVNAHVNKNYVLSIPALLPLVDGLADEIRRRHPQAAAAYKAATGAHKKKRKLIAVTEVVGLYDSKGRAADWVDSVIDAVTIQIYGEYSFASEAPPSPLNRHGILHGRIANYQSEPNSLKAFLLLDVMSHISGGLPSKLK